MSKRLHLFQGYGIELEYMIVDRETLDVLPLSDELLRMATGKYVEDFVNGEVTWSNELVMHVIELKCSEPVTDLEKLESEFEANIRQINGMLKNKLNARLMPTAAHPWMNPGKESFIWPYGNSGIYKKYDEIFSCRGHGWSNLQSVHINLPCYDDEEFASLHTAVRFLLPILPGLAASSPILDSNATGMHDTRMVYYEKNQQRIESITGKIIPERVTSRRQYQKHIYSKIADQIRAYDPKGILDPVWVNSRGVIARFDRGSVEIRILDIQECPKADLAIAALVIHSVRLLVEGKLAGHHEQLSWDTDRLYAILQKSIKKSSQALIEDTEYLAMFGLDRTSCTVSDLWLHLLSLCTNAYPKEMAPWENVLKNILHEGSLALRILNAANGLYNRNNMLLVYQELCENLEENKLFAPCDHSILS